MCYERGAKARVRTGMAFACCPRSCYDRRDPLYVYVLFWKLWACMFDLSLRERRHCYGHNW